MTTDADLDAIIDRLDAIHRTTGHSLDRVFRDWVELATLAFARDDDAYRDRLDRYRTDRMDEADHREVAEAFSEALGEVVATTAEVGRPVIGDVYEVIGADSDALGQHFTPWPVCEMNAGLLIAPDDVEGATPDDPLRVADPAVGSGRLLVATAMAATDAVDGAGDVPMVVQGTDKDATCARMAVLNLVMAGLRGRIRYGDSITQEMWREWRVDPAGPPPVVRIVEDPADTVPELAAPETTDTEASDVDAGDAQAGLDVFVGGED